MRETQYQSRVVDILHDLFPGCTTLRNDPRHIQGIPDLLFLYEDFWAMLEVKLSAAAPTQPNQEYYVDHFNRMSFAAFIFPENEEDVLNDLQQAIRFSRQARVS